MTVDFLAGATFIAWLTVALFFMRVWLHTRDRIFLLFAVAFTVFAVNRVVLTILEDESEGRTIVYLVRAVAFLVIAAAIVDKNRPARDRSG